MKARGLALREWWVVAAIFLIALGLRTWQLAENPPGLYLDEAAYGLDALSTLQGNFSIFYERNNGREPLFIWLLALVFSVVGATPYTIRLTAALCGALTVVSTWWMVRELLRFDSGADLRRPRWVAAWVALLLAVSYWHLSLSRLGFRAITSPLLITLAFALIWRTWNSLRARPGDVTIPPAAWAAGALLGLSLYTYTAARAAPLLFLLSLALIWLRSRELGINRRALVRSCVAILGTMAAVALPLILYFLRHPEFFGEHAAYVSIFNDRFSAGDPLAALWTSSSQTVLMLVGLASDPNLRHNPAARPAFEWFWGIWLAIGLLSALVSWRKAAHFFALLWTGVFLAPVVLSAEGVPHSLRSIVLLPGLCLIAVLGMEWAGGVLARGLRPSWGAVLRNWLPLPFVFASALMGARAYFGAWQDVDKFRAPFFADFLPLAETLDSTEARSVLWLLPLSPGEDLTEDRMSTLDFLLRLPSHVATLRLDEETTPARLEQLAAPYSTVHVLTTFGVPVLTHYDTRFMDLKGYLDLILRRNLAGPAERSVRDGEVAGFPYRTYQLAARRDFTLPAPDLSADVSFGDRVALTAVNVGESPMSGEPLVIEQPADQPVWAILRWKALQPIAEGTKSSLVLRSADSGSAGIWAGQVDQPLISDSFPRQLVWQSGEAASSYALFYPVAGSPPGRYQLELTVYDEASGRTYPAISGDGLPAAQYVVAELHLSPPILPASETQPAVQRNELLFAPALRLVGIDPPAASASPGQEIVATMHLHAEEVPAADIRLAVELRSVAGEVVAGTELVPGGSTYPTGRWRKGETMRVWSRLALPADLPPGAYDYGIRASGEGVGAPFLPLATVNVEGRVRLFEEPSVTLAAEAAFGGVVDLRGLVDSTLAAAAPGKALELRFVWHVTSAEPRELVRFVQLLNPSGELVSQNDSAPCATECPSPSWLQGEYLLDAVEIRVPEGSPAGEYSLLVGWYDAATQVRLSATAPNGDSLADSALRLPFVVQSDD